MTLPNPSLDDLSFDEIFNKIRKKIPAYSQEWTNFNYSDPGITFLDLFSWVAENKIYSLNFIPRRNYLKFLKLLGIIPRPPMPLQIAFKLENEGRESGKIDKGCLLESKLIPDLKLRIDNDIEILQTNLTKILLVRSKNPDSENYELSNINDFDKHGWNIEPFVGYQGICIGLAIDKVLLNKTKTVNFLISIKHYLEDKYPIGKHCEESFVRDRNDIIWEYAIKNGSHKLQWSRFEKDIDDGTNGFEKSGIISFKITFDKQNTNVDLSPYIETKNKSTDGLKLFWIRCTLKEEKNKEKERLYTSPSAIIDEIVFNCVSATQGLSMSETFPKDIPSDQNSICETLGLTSSNVPGLPNQQIQLSHTPILEVESVYIIPNKSYIRLDSERNHVELYETDSSLQSWDMVNDFDNSSSTDQHFTVDYINGVISFGDGKNGLIPPMYSKIIVNYVYGTPKPAIPSGQSFEIYGEKDHDYISGLTATSKLILSEGRTAESLKEVISRAQTELKKPYTAVTLEDIEYIAKNTPDLRIARASAYIGKENEIEIVVIPAIHEDKPVPTKPFTDTVCRHLDKHRLLTTHVTISKPKYVEVSVNATITASPGLKASDIVEVLNNFLTPISQAPDYPGWKMGRPVYRSEIISKIENVPGVDCVDSIYISAKEVETGLTINKYPNIDIDALAFVTHGNHIITINHIETKCKKQQPVTGEIKLGYESDTPHCNGME